MPEIRKELVRIRTKSLEFAKKMRIFEKIWIKIAHFFVNFNEFVRKNTNFYENLRIYGEKRNLIFDFC